MLYERARNLDALSYRSSFAEIQRVAREVVTSTLAYDTLLTPTLAERPVPICKLKSISGEDCLNISSRLTSSRLVQRKNLVLTGSLKTNEHRWSVAGYLSNGGSPLGPSRPLGSRRSLGGAF